MNLENTFTATHIRSIDHHLTIEASRTQECRVEYIRPVCSGDDDNTVILIEAIHLDEELVQGLLTLVVATAKTCATVASDGVNLVDKDDTRRMLFRLIEEIAYAGGTDADKH